MQVNILEAKSQLSKLVKAALDGEDVIIAKHGTPVVRLVKLSEQARTRGYGAWKHLGPLPDDWDSPETNAAIAKLILDNPIEPPEPRSKPNSSAKRAKTVTRTPK